MGVSSRDKVSTVSGARLAILAANNPGIIELALKVVS
jgi:hypothetical protein